ncbi:sensor histidine kinase [Pseudoalteromonas sp. T1lg65]|uniref:sensor histidine kinase n=1 Tax=Pseudoalteromonas sp. T1lg65 TaxID=2077101 RepID=UPI003F7900F8
MLRFDELPELKTKEVLRRIRSRASKLLNFVNAYTKLSQLPAPTPCRFDFAEVCNQAAFEQNITLSFYGEQYLLTDPMLLELVTINLLKNAKEATQEQIRVVIDVKLKGKTQCITIEDNGPGFANLDNVLTPFYTTKEQGQGLGLALCQDIIRLHGGCLHVANSQQGAKVVLEIPLHKMSRK